MVLSIQTRNILKEVSNTYRMGLPSICDGFHADLTVACDLSISSSIWPVYSFSNNFEIFCIHVIENLRLEEFLRGKGGGSYRFLVPTPKLAIIRTKKE